MKRMLFWAPLGVVILFVAIAAVGLSRPSSAVVTSKMIGKPVPVFALPAASSSLPGVRTADFKQGKPRLINFFASWCVPCAAESKQLLALKQAGIPIEGVAIRDKPADVERFLDRFGNPFMRIGSDVDSSVQIAMGSSGVPETFLIDGEGTITYQHIGDIRPENVPEIIAAWRRAAR